MKGCGSHHSSLAISERLEFVFQVLGFFYILLKFLFSWFSVHKSFFPVGIISLKNSFHIIVFQANFDFIFNRGLFLETQA